MTPANLSLNLDPELKEWLGRQAKSEDRSEEPIATRALKSLKNFKDAKDQMIREAMAEADKGVFISQEAMDAWVMSWDTNNELPPPEPDIFLAGNNDETKISGFDGRCLEMDAILLSARFSRWSRKRKAAIF